MNDQFDIAIIGSGFGGALMSMVARRLGLSALLLERGKHPRFAIGESTSPLANLLLEELASRYDLPFLLPLTSFGPWQRTYPEIACGLKRGFTFYAHQAGQPFTALPDRSSQLMVAASPRDEVADMHWFRADVDHFFVKRAVQTGVDYRDEMQVTALERDGAEGWRLMGERHGNAWRASARLLIDATGPRGLLSRYLDLSEAAFDGFPTTQAIFTHFTGVKRCDAMEVYYQHGAPPYPPDDAALHHVFDGGWMWVLRFGNGITSAGFALKDDLARDVGLPGNLEAVWDRLMQRFPSIGEQFADAQPVRPFVYLPRLAYRCAQAAGEDWALLPSAAAFIDPLFSTGIPLTLLGIERLGRILAEDWQRPTLPSRLRDYDEVTLDEADHTARYIGACYRAMPVFPLFAAMSMFYFAAASYSEMARRLNQRHLVRRYLAADRADFVEGMLCCARMLPQAIAAGDAGSVAGYEREVQRAIDCMNVAGLSDPNKCNWYGVDLADVVQGAGKLEMTPEQMRHVLATAHWTQF